MRGILAGLLISLLALAAITLSPTAVRAQVLPEFKKSFEPSTIGPNGTSELNFTISNFSLDPITDLAFMDLLPAGMTLADPTAAQADGCGDLAITAADGGADFSVADGAIGGDGICRISVFVTAAAPDTYTNTTGALTSSVGSSGAAIADLTVSNGRAAFTKSFSSASRTPSRRRPSRSDR
jgi:uncharacterized repeat protein (TIGR01451 family)